MAKDEEQMENYDDGEDLQDKPKKKKNGKKKSSKTYLWIGAFVVILVVLLVIRLKTMPVDDVKDAAEEETAPEEEVEEQVVTEPRTRSTDSTEYYDDEDSYEAPTDLGESVVDKEALPNVQSNIDTTLKPELFSNIQCNYDDESGLLYMSLRVYNVMDEDFIISPVGVAKGYNTYFFIRGVVDTDPGCGTEVLQPGEYTECTKIGFDNLRYGNVPGINRISVQVPTKTEALLVECPEFPEAAAEE